MKNVFYYVTVMNQNYAHPAMPARKGIEQEILNGMYLLQEGINEPGAISSWIASATSYANSRYTTIPFYILLLNVRFPTCWRLGLGSR